MSQLYGYTSLMSGVVNGLLFTEAGDHFVTESEEDILFPLGVHQATSFNAPQFTRLRHRYRGPRESEKVNLEINQLYYSLRKLYERYDTFQEGFVDRASAIFEGGETGAEDHLALKLDGVGTSHADIPDVNVLDANTAHLEQSVGRWAIGETNLAFPTGISTAIVASPAPFGSNAMRVTHTGTASSGVGSDATVTGLPSSTVYTFGVWLRASEEITLRVLARPTESSSVGTTTSVGTAWELVAVTVTTTASGSLDTAIRIEGPANSGWFEVGAAFVRQGTNPTFVPSHRIRGNIDIRARFRAEALAPTEWYPAQVGHRVVPAVTNTGLMRVYAANTSSWDGIGGINSTIPLPSPLTLRELRYVVVPNNGSGAWEASFYYRAGPPDDWTQLGTTRVGPADSAFSIRNVSGEVRAGIFNPHPNFNAPSVHYNAEFRDGIDGVVVARFDVNSGWQDGDTAPASNFDAQGNEWTLHDKATVVAEVKHSMTEGLESLVKRLDVLKRRVKVLEA